MNISVANTLVRYQPGETVFAQGDRSADVLYIRRGGVKLTVRSRTGRVAIIATLRAGSFFGEGVLAGQRWRNCSAETLITSTIAVVKTGDMRRGLSEKPMLADCFLSHLLDRHIRTESDLIDLLFQSQREAAGASRGARRSARSC